MLWVGSLLSSWYGVARSTPRDFSAAGMAADRAEAIEEAT
jgi:hypothetical protein